MQPTSGNADEISWRELQHAVDEELNRLPKAYAEPLVLCYLEGWTQDEAARELGCTAGAVRGRLVRGREMLRVRLARRGLTAAPAIVIAALVPSLSSAAVPSSLVASTAAASISGAVPPAVA